MCGKFSVLALAGWLILAFAVPLNAQVNIGKWRRHVVTLNNSTYSGNPFELAVEARFTHTTTSAQLTLPGYYDGSNQWKIGFMPTKLGEWTYTTSSGDSDLDNYTGTINCVPSGHPGPLAEDPSHRNKWKYADGGYVVPIGVFVSAMLDSATTLEWATMADFIQDNNLQLLNFRISEHDLAFSSVGSLQMHLPRWQRLEERVEALTERGIGIDIMLYTDDEGVPSFGPYSTAEQLLIRYTVARLASFPVVMFNSGIDIAEYRDQSWVNWYGQQVEGLDPYGHPVSSRYTGGSGRLKMSGQTYNSVGDRNSTIANLLRAYDLTDHIPASNNDNWSEDLTGNINGHTRQDIRRAGWKAVVSGGIVFHVRHNTRNCFGGLIQSCDRYFDADSLASQLDSEAWLKLVNPFVQDKLGDTFAMMDPASSLVTGAGGKYALADATRTKVVYMLMGQNDTWDSGDGGNITVRLGGVSGHYDATWFDPRTGNEASAGTLAGGSDHTLSPPSTDDWILVVVRPETPLIALDKIQITRAVHFAENLPDDTFTVANGGVGELNYAIRSDQPWLSLDPSVGSSTGEQDTITISYKENALSIGAYTATIEVVDNGSSPPSANSPQNIILTLKVKTVLPDFDHDGDVDLTDFGLLQSCFTMGMEGIRSECSHVDMNGDELVDQTDLGVFQTCASGANILADEACDDGFE